MREQGTGNRDKRAFVLFLGVVAAALTTLAFAPIPKESAKALKVTRGRPFSAGAVFVNGKYIDPPYAVERWGTGIRINGIQVTGQVIDWNEFLKTQRGMKVVSQEPVAEPPPAAAPVATPAPVAAADVSESSLDDLFDDDPKPAVKEEAADVGKVSAVTKPKPVLSYALEGEFVPNDATKSMVARINARRTEIDRTLRTGGFICFGDTYSQVSGDSRTLLDLLNKLPEIQKESQNVQQFCQGVGAANMVYLNEVLRWDLYRNRIDYRRLQERRAKLKKDSEFRKMLNEVSGPLF